MTSNTAVPLKPCHFCGSEDLFTQPALGRSQVVCETCEASGPTEETDEEAVEAWNRRAPASEVQAEAVQSAWIDVAAELPRSEWDKYYHDDFSAPVAVMIDYKGHVRLSEITWRYSFAHGGWVHADLGDGWKPDDYSDYGRVTHWAPLPEPLAAPASSAGDQ